MLGVPQSRDLESLLAEVVRSSADVFADAFLIMVLELPECIYDELANFSVIRVEGNVEDFYRSSDYPFRTGKLDTDGELLIETAVVMIRDLPDVDVDSGPGSFRWGTHLIDGGLPSIRSDC
ncbi:MAG: hypothetical protein M1818_006757 [Claussenomyces sp. TS43310]|nr:MAG: hypothetical protein M1818_006757 [Claussenomyces sp. TS43310]